MTSWLVAPQWTKCAASLSSQGDERDQLFNDWDRKVARNGSAGGNLFQIEKFGATLGGDNARGGLGNESNQCFGPGERGFEVQKALQMLHVRKNMYYRGAAEELVEKIHSVSFSLLMLSTLFQV